MKYKRHLLLESIGYAITVVVMIGVFIFVGSDVDTEGVWMAGIFTVIFAFLAIRGFRKLKHVREEERIYEPDTDATKQDKVKFYKRAAFYGAFGFAGVTLWTVEELDKFESGKIPVAKLWEPVGLLYRLGGYWCAVLVPVGLALFMIIFLLKKAEDINSEQELFFI